MEDFIFGTLATDALRLAHARRLRGGITHHYARSPYAPKPGQAVQVELTLGPAQACEAAWLYWAAGGGDPQGAGGVAVTGQAVAMQKVEAEWDVVEWGYLQHYRAAIPAQPEGTLVRYFLTARMAGGEEIAADGGKYYAYYVTGLGLPEWARDAVVYQVMPDRFFPGTGKSWEQPAYPSGFYGGTLRGITEKLDYIAALGANVIWMTPIFPSPSPHGYDATDLFSVEPRYGSKEDLRLLLDEAHARGLRVLLDFVPNHWSDRHPSFQNAITDPSSPQRSWYNFKHWPDDYESFFGVKELPQVNLRNPGARQHMLDAAAYWLEFGVDGYRLDYAVGPTPDFWADFRRVCATVKPDAWTFGEIVEPPDSQRNFYGLLNGALDFMLLEALRQTFAFKRWNAHQFSAFLERHEAYFPRDFSRPSFLDNHDMNRYLWAVGGDIDSLKMAALCQFTLAGPPVIYYGTEAGLSQERDVRQGGLGLPEESRLPMPWGDQQDGELLAFYRRLVDLRRSEPALRRGSRQSFPCGDKVVAYRRDTPDQSLAVVINLSEDAQQLEIPGRWVNLLLASRAGAVIKPDNTATEIEIPGRSGLVMR